MDSGMQNNQPKTPASSTVDAAMKAPHPGDSDFGLSPEDAVSKVADKIQHSTNILILTLMKFLRQSL